MASNAREPTTAVVFVRMPRRRPARPGVIGRGHAAFLLRQRLRVCDVPLLASAKLARIPSAQRIGVLGGPLGQPYGTRRGRAAFEQTGHETRNLLFGQKNIALEKPNQAGDPKPDQRWH